MYFDYLKLAEGNFFYLKEITAFSLLEPPLKIESVQI